MTARTLRNSRRRGHIPDASRALTRDASDLTFSVRSLTERAGVSIATPHNLFGSKEAILLALPWMRIWPNTGSKHPITVPGEEKP